MSQHCNFVTAAPVFVHLKENSTQVIEDTWLSLGEWIFTFVSTWGSGSSPCCLGNNWNQCIKFWSYGMRREGKTGSVPAAPANLARAARAAFQMLLTAQPPRRVCECPGYAGWLAGLQGWALYLEIGDCRLVLEGTALVQENLAQFLNQDKHKFLTWNVSQ